MSSTPRLHDDLLAWSDIREVELANAVDDYEAKSFDQEAQEHPDGVLSYPDTAALAAEVLRALAAGESAGGVGSNLLQHDILEAYRRNDRAYRRRRADRVVAGSRFLDVQKLAHKRTLEQVIYLHNRSRSDA